MQLTQSIEQAKKYLSLYFPLQSFIAVNPLWDLTNHNFAELCHHFDNYLMPKNFYLRKYQRGQISQQAIDQAFDSVTNHYQLDKALRKQIKDHLFVKHTESQKSKKLLYAKQVKNYQFQKSTSWISENIFKICRDYYALAVKSDKFTLSLIDFWQQQLSFSQRRLLKNLQSPNYIEALLQKINIPSKLHLDYFHAIFKRVYGWASFTKWVENHADNPWIQANAHVQDFITMWLFFEYCIKEKYGQSYQHQAAEEPQTSEVNRYILLVWQKAIELDYQQLLLAKLKLPQAQTKQTVDFQAVFCIDTRSEGLRRHLEKISQSATFGFAGFFGFIFKTAEDDGSIKHQCPAILQPSQCVRIQQQQDDLLRRSVRSPILSLSTAKNIFFSPYALFEIFGNWMIIKLILKLFLPVFYAKCSRGQNLQYQKAAIHFVMQENKQTLAQSAASFLQTIGLHQYFAKEVVICSHSSTSDNNPFASSLDCGACGGNSGIINAVVAAEALNNQDVRRNLQQLGINIPTDTRFIAANHNTTLDEISFYHEASPPLKQAFKKACKHLRRERRRDLPGYNKVQRRAYDWSELIPELGLANNAALIIGPRDFSKQADLARRTFLHSYEPSIDPEGTILDSIFKGPLLVAHWINSQYYFATVKPEQFSAGNKTIHNIIPGIGVMCGNLSDLKIGLPEQSVFYRQKCLHQPLRLFVVIVGNPLIVDKTIENNPAIKQLLNGGWISLKVVEPSHQ